MDRSVTVKTPESIAFSYELAGLGSRFLALAVDLLIQIVILGAVIWSVLLLLVAEPRTRLVRPSTTLESIAMALIVVTIFIVFFGYFILFEAFWNGRTPGKKVIGLRVVRDGGYAVDFTSAALRNLVRIGEASLGFYAISALACILSPENKRLGDMVAGTVVVRDSPVPLLTTVIAAAEDQRPSTVLTQQEHAIIDRFVARRASLEPPVRKRMAARIAAQVRPRLSYDLQHLSDDELLEKLSGW